MQFCRTDERWLHYNLQCIKDDSVTTKLKSINGFHLIITCLMILLFDSGNLPARSGQSSFKPTKAPCLFRMRPAIRHIAERGTLLGGRRGPPEGHWVALHQLVSLSHTFLARFLFRQHCLDIIQYRINIRCLKVFLEIAS